jgi:hypothetical protein
MNTKTRKYVLIGGAVLVALYVFNKKSFKGTSQDPNIDEPSAVADKDKYLSLGSTGLEVMLLQKELGNLAVDGIFGVKTQARLKELKGVSLITLNQLNK